MKDSIFIIEENTEIAADMFEMKLRTTESDFAEIRPGQFINIQLDGRFLRRPISICDWDESAERLTIAYKLVGQGMAQMTRMQAGERLDILWPLGNGYDITPQFERPLLIGGGAGVPPIVGLCRRLIEVGKGNGVDVQPAVVLGFHSAADVIYQSVFERMGAQVLIATEDGSTGTKGFVTDVICDMDSMDAFFACGPEAMLRAVDRMLPGEMPGQLSFEERMGCGFGACMGCSCRTKYGSKRICKDGPVLRREEIVW